MSDQRSVPQKGGRWVYLLATSILLAVTLLTFARSLQTNIVVFSNDGPLGVIHSEALRVPGAFQGFWMDSNWIGLNGKHAVACLTYGFLALVGPIEFAKFYPALAIFLAGVGGFLFFRTLGLTSGLATVGAIGAALNSNFFSNTCWGLGSRSITLACIFLALAALSTRRLGNRWLNAVLAGFAVGMAVVEGADNGVIFSLFVAAFVIWQAWIGPAETPAPTSSTSATGSGRAPVGQGGTGTRLAAGALRLALVAVFAGFMATQSLISLFDIASKTAVTASASAETKEQKWSFATQWSLPPAETSRVLIPGLYGYRMDTPDGGNYWGRVGESPGAPGSRFSGAGEYAGVLVVLVALWSAVQSFRRAGSPYSDRERKMMWFWVATCLVSTVLAWGKYTPLYGLTVYQLPYFSSIRNPMKFMHVAHLALMVLFGYGLLGLGRRHLEGAKPGSGKGASAGQGWTYGLIGLVVLSAVAFMAYASNKPALIQHLERVGFEGAQGPSASAIARFSIGEFGWFVFFMALSAGALLGVVRGWFAGARATWGAVVLGLILTVDLWRANAPWVIYWDYQYKYATNPILDILRAKPHEARVVAPAQLVDPRMAQAAGGMTYLFPQLYAIEWVQHHFQYYNIQSIDVAQDPRPPADKMAYLQAMRDLGRYWQLTNTRYVLGMTGFLGALNQQIDHGRNRFQVRATFELVPKPGVTPTQLQDFTVQPAANGPLALFEYTGALPRAKLFAKWLVSTNGDEALKTLTDPAFDPWSAVVVSDEIAASSTVATNADGGTVTFASYAPRRIELKANATAASVLLLNDRYDADWRVTVDGQPAKLLRANFIMRGVQVPAGDHTVVFEFRPSLKGLKVSLAAMLLSGALVGLLFVVRQEEPGDQPKLG